MTISDPSCNGLLKQDVLATDHCIKPGAAGPSSLVPFLLGRVRLWRHPVFPTVLVTRADGLNNAGKPLRTTEERNSVQRQEQTTNRTASKNVEACFGRRLLDLFLHFRRRVDPLPLPALARQGSSQ